jgi:hypothetical protein
MPNPWTLVTGASGGIGLEIAKQLATRGDRLVLVARSAGTLESVATTLQQAGSPEVLVLPADLGSSTGVQHVLDEVARRGLEVETLVNNAGFGGAGAFATQDAAEQAGMIELNIRALTALTRQLLPPMLARQRGAVLNVASVAGFQPGPFMAVYYATKAYVIALSEALRAELKGTGVMVVTLCPGPTATGFASRAGMNNSNLFRFGAVMDAATVARAGVDRLGKGGLVIPGVMNKVLVQSQRISPRAMVTAITRQLNSGRAP